MKLLYDAGIRLYGLMARIVALFNAKAALWVRGRQNLFGSLTTFINTVNRDSCGVIWFHVSSLGEFEQGRPVIEACRNQWPGKKILVTFFSPSGYEVRKNYDLADHVCYLPEDTLTNARRFLEIVQPELVIFVKYDFWFNFIAEITSAGIPLIYVSVLFRPGQYYFKWYGKWAVRRLGMIDHFFVQDQQTADLMQSVGITRVSVAGDTRFDRVFAIAQQSLPDRLVERFCGSDPVFIAGSCWEPDEAVFLPLLNQNSRGMKFIIAPHDTRPERINAIREKIEIPLLTYTMLTEENARSAPVLIIDCIGVLNKLYRYATVAFIGGGFGSGLHNIQEPVTFGVPVFFGPVYHKFREAVDLVRLGGAFEISSTAGLSDKISYFLDNPEAYRNASAVCKRYVDENRGATGKIMQYLTDRRITE